MARLLVWKTLVFFSPIAPYVPMFRNAHRRFLTSSREEKMPSSSQSRRASGGAYRARRGPLSEKLACGWSPTARRGV